MLMVFGFRGKRRLALLPRDLINVLANMTRRMRLSPRWPVFEYCWHGLLYGISKSFNLIVRLLFCMPKSVTPSMRALFLAIRLRHLDFSFAFWLPYMAFASQPMSFICSLCPFSLNLVWFVAKLIMESSLVNGYLLPILRLSCQRMEVPLCFMSRYTLMMASELPTPNLYMLGFYRFFRSVFMLSTWDNAQNSLTSSSFEIALAVVFGSPPATISLIYSMNGIWLLVVQPLHHFPPISLIFRQPLRILCLPFLMPTSCLNISV